MTAIEFTLARRFHQLEVTSKTRRLTTRELDLLEFLEPLVVAIEQREAAIQGRESVREYLTGASKALPQCQTGAPTLPQSPQVNPEKGAE